VYRLVRAFGSEVLDGTKLYSSPTVATGITSLIKNCDGVIGVVSVDVARRPWVLQELGAAHAAGKSNVLVLRERGAVDNLGMFDEKQYIEYDPNDLTECLVSLTEALGQWHAPRDVFVYLLPDTFAKAIRPYLNGGGALNSTYEVLDENHDVISSGPARIVEPDGRMQVKLRGISPQGRYLQFKASFGKESWISDLQSIGMRSMTMQKI
jgi:hypothetical protein